MAKFYFIQAYPANREAHVYIYGDIVTEKWFDEEVSASSFANEINAIDVDTLHVHIDSYGGAVSEGFALYNSLKSHPAKVITHADGFVASAAIYPFLAGDERIASPLSAFYLHQVLCSVTGNADQLRAAANEAEILNSIGLNAFAACGVDAESILQLEKDEVWITPEIALSLGICTAISAGEDGDGPVQSVRCSVLQALLNSQKEPKQAHIPEPKPTPAPKMSFFEFISKSII